MKPFKILHMADLHADGEPGRRKLFLAASEEVARIARQEVPDLILIAGDVFHRQQPFNDKGAVEDVQSFLDRLVMIAPIAIVKGNNEHDNPGSIEPLDRVDATILSTELPSTYGLYESSGWREENDGIGSDEQPRAIVHFLPYPTKQFLMQIQSDASIDAANANAEELLGKLMDGFKILADRYSCPKILLAHCNVRDSKLSNGQTIASQDVYFNASTLERSGADYVALGHIHLAQELGRRCAYSGSIYHVDWGETEKKQVNILEWRDLETSKVFEMRRVVIPSTPMSKHEAMLTPGGDLVDTGFSLQDWLLARLRVRVKIKEEMRNAYPPEVIHELVRRKYAGANELTVEIQVEPTQRVRSESFSKTRSLREKLEAWSEATVQQVPVGTLELADQVEKHAKEVQP